MKCYIITELRRDSDLKPFTTSLPVIVASYNVAEQIAEKRMGLNNVECAFVQGFYMINSIDEFDELMNDRNKEDHFIKEYEDHLNAQCRMERELMDWIKTGGAPKHLGCGDD